MTANEYGLIKEIFNHIYDAVRFNQDNARDRDSYRSYHTAERFSSCALILQDMMLDVKWGTWEDGDIEKIGFLSVEGFRVVDKGEWNYEQSRLLGDVLQHKVNA